MAGLVMAILASYCFPSCVNNKHSCLEFEGIDLPKIVLIFMSISGFFFVVIRITLSSIPLSNRMAHPGGPLTTNKAAALVKFLERTPAT
jgi:hypothetical protein